MRICASLLALSLFAVDAYVNACAAQVRVKADLACSATNEKLKYECVIKLTNTRTNEPLSGLTLTVGADMPSMPMVHNVPPVPASAGSDPGVYRARIVLEMHGDWAVRLDLAGPVRDRIVEVLRFEDGRVSPGSRARQPHSRH